MELSSSPDNKVVALAIASFSFLSALYVYRKTRPSAVLPPGPPQAPILGNLLQMPKERPWLKYAQWTEEYGESYLAMSWELILHSRLGDIVHVRVFSQHLIILSNYEDATRLMIEAKYSDRLQTVMLHDLYVSVTTSTMSLIPFYNRMDFNWGVSPTPYGSEWRYGRKLLHEQFNQHEVTQYADQQEESTRMMLQDLLNTPDDFCANVRQ